MIKKRHRNKHFRFQFKIKPRKDRFDYVIYFFSIVAPLFEIPQLWEILVNKSAENVAIVTWAFYLVDNIVWIIYGFKRKDWPIIISSSLYLIIEGAIVVGILLYS